MTLGGICLCAAAVNAQQIYRWTDETGKVHFGNQPPPGTKNLEAKDREKGEIEIECEAAVKDECQDYIKKYGKWQDSEAYRDCLERRSEACAHFQPRAVPTKARERFISTPTLAFDPALGDSLRCEMRCPNRCRGQVEIRSDRVLKKGENYGIDRYAMEMKPQQAGSAFCTVSTPSEDVQLVLSVLRDGGVTAVVEGQ
jgi:hypothetical protein